MSPAGLCNTKQTELLSLDRHRAQQQTPNCLCLLILQKALLASLCFRLCVVCSFSFCSAKMLTRWTNHHNFNNNNYEDIYAPPPPHAGWYKSSELVGVLSPVNHKGLLSGLSKHGENEMTFMDTESNFHGWIRGGKQKLDKAIQKIHYNWAKYNGICSSRASFIRCRIFCSICR